MTPVWSSPFQTCGKMCPFSQLLGKERSQGKRVKVYSPSARSVMVASRFSSGRDGFALGEEQEQERRRTSASSGFWVRKWIRRNRSGRAVSRSLQAQFCEKENCQQIHSIHQYTLSVHIIELLKVWAYRLMIVGKVVSDVVLYFAFTVLSFLRSCCVCHMYCNV